MRLEEVIDESDLQNDDQFSDVSASDSESDLDDFEHSPLDETMYERFLALRDIIPPPARAELANVIKSCKNTVGTVALFGGKSLWAVMSSLLLLGIPFMMAVETEAQAQEEEKALAMQQGANDLLGSGAQSPVFQSPQQAQQSVRPPGF